MSRTPRLFRRAVALAVLFIVGLAGSIGVPNAQAQADLTSTDTRTVAIGEALAPITPSYIGANFTAQLLPTSQLPAGLGLVSDGYFVDSPSETGIYTIEILLTDANTQQQELHIITLLVRSAETSAVTSEVGLTPDALVAASGRTLLSAEIVAGQLPTGIGMAGDGIFSGAASTPGIYEADILITDLVTDEVELRTVSFIIGVEALDADADANPAEDETTAEANDVVSDAGDATDGVLGVTQLPEEIAFTGAESWVLSAAGLTMIVAGSTSVIAGRRRQRQAFLDHIG